MVNANNLVVEFGSVTNAIKHVEATLELIRSIRSTVETMSLYREYFEVLIHLKSGNFFDLNSTNK